MSSPRASPALTRETELDLWGSEPSTYSTDALTPRASAAARSRSLSRGVRVRVLVAFSALIEGAASVARA
eukprot:311714-Alexandrium_andersonii.AAC.1